MTDLVPIAGGIVVAAIVGALIYSLGQVAIVIVERRRARRGMPAASKRALAADRQRRRAVLPQGR